MQKRQVIDDYYELEKIYYLEERLIFSLTNLASNRNFSYKISDATIMLGSLYMKYPGYVDELGIKLICLGLAIRDNNDKFIDLINSSGIDFLHSILIDIDVWLKRYNKEGISKETEHIFHLPTLSSIDQIINMISSEDNFNDNYDSFEFF